MILAEYWLIGQNFTNKLVRANKQSISWLLPAGRFEASCKPERRSTYLSINELNGQTL